MSAVDGEKLLEKHGIKNPKNVYYNLPIKELYDEVVKRGEGEIAEGETIVVSTGNHTGRSPNDRFIVKEPSTENDIQLGSG